MYERCGRDILYSFTGPRHWKPEVRLWNFEFYKNALDMHSPPQDQQHEGCVLHPLKTSSPFCPYQAYLMTVYSHRPGQAKLISTPSTETPDPTTNSELPFALALPDIRSSQNGLKVEHPSVLPLSLQLSLPILKYHYSPYKYTALLKSALSRMAI